MQSTIIDELETDYGVSILSDLTGQHLTRNRQPVRLFDQTRHSSEYFFRSDEQGKPYIQNFAEGKRYYPVTAYCQTYDVDYATAKEELCQQYGVGNANNYHQTTTRPRPQPQPRPVSPSVDYLPAEVYAQSQTQFERNGFYQYLTELFDSATATELFRRYRLGTSRRWHFEGMLATCFPQFDQAGNLRQVKVIPFHPLTGRRAKAHQSAYRLNHRSNQYEPDTNEKVWFAGKSLAGSDSVNLQQCYFGEHLLSEDSEKTVALVEGESTAIVCSAIWPDYMWLATGGSNGGKWYDADRFQVFKGRKLVLWPDSGKYEDWRQKARPLRELTYSLNVTRYVEDNAPAGAGNIDLRDLLTWPRYTPEDGKPIFGEVLTMGEASDYPADWDEPHSPDAVPTIKQRTPAEYMASLQNKPN